MRPIRIAAQLHPQHGAYPTCAGRPSAPTRWATTSPTRGTTSSRCTAAATTPTSSAGRCSPRGRRRPAGSSSGRSWRAIVPQPATCSRTWRGQSTTSAAGASMLGLGAGWSQRDYDEYGYEFGTVGDRDRRPARALPEIERRLAALDPPPRAPDADPHRRGRASGGRLRLVARYADAWHAASRSTPTSSCRRSRALRRWCAEIGRDPADIEWGVGVEPEDLDRFLADDADDLRRDGLHPVHARVQRSRVDGRPRPAVARLAGRAERLPRLRFSRRAARPSSPRVRPSRPRSAGARR